MTTVVVLIAFFIFVRYMDTRWAYVPYTMAVTVALASIIFLLSKRPYFSLHCATLFSVLQACASFLKYKLNGLALHVYDIIFGLGDWSLIQFLVQSYGYLLVVGGVAVLLAAALLCFVFKAERPVRYGWGMRTAIFPFACAICVAVFPRTKTHDSEYLPFTAGYNASALYFSLAHVPYLVAPPPLSAKLANVRIDNPFVDGVDCRPDAKKPDLYVVLQESQAPLTLFPDLKTPDDSSQLFTSGDDKVHPLHVETFGAGTWMTNFAVLTGLSTADFGWQAPYVNKFMEGRIRGSLPEVLSRCGYRTIAMMTLRYHAINEGPFLKSLGFDDVYDADGMGLTAHGLRDKAYFDFVDKIVAQHRKTDGRPLFIAMQTMFTHSPYTESLVADSEVATGISVDPEANEYGRRMLVSRRDFRAFLRQRESDPGKDGTIVAEFGDHQAIATRRFVDTRNFGDMATTDFGSKMYETFFSVHAFGAPFDYGRLNQPEDVAFLAAKVLDAGNLPTSPIFEDLSRLSALCGGRFHLCRERAAIDEHLKRRIDGAMLRLN